MPSPFDILVSDKISAVVTAAVLEVGLAASRVAAVRFHLLGARVMGSFPFIEAGHAEQIRVPVNSKSGSSYGRLQLSECSESVGLSL